MAMIITPNWPQCAGISAISTTRVGGSSKPPFSSLNLGLHVGDEPEVVESNRQLLSRQQGLPSAPFWLEQVHGIDVAVLSDNLASLTHADAAYTQAPNHVCAVMTADCLPVLFYAQSGDEVAAAHAGWRGLCEGILENSVAHFKAKPENIVAWLGPAIGPDCFEVGEEVRARFIDHDPNAQHAFIPKIGSKGKFLADIYQLARQRLSCVGVSQIFGGDYCTYSDSLRFFSYRREGKTGRMASMIWFSAKEREVCL